MSDAAHVDLVQEVNSLLKTLGQNQRTLDTVQARLLKFETNQTRMENQLDVLRIQQPVTSQLSRCTSLRFNMRRILVRLKETKVKHGVYTQFAR